MVMEHFNSHPHEEDDGTEKPQGIWFIYFNSHPHEEDDMAKASIHVTKTNFNSHPHEEDDPCSSTIISKIFWFQLTSSRRGWQFFFWYVFYLLCHFNSHPHEEDDTQLDELGRETEHFNSHPHEEDDFENVVETFTSIISTHILTKRMTLE